MTKPLAHTPPKMYLIKNDANRKEVFECHWRHSDRNLKIFKVTNISDKRKLQIAQNKNQLNELLKPIRIKHGTPNHAKALLLKLLIPFQIQQPSFEEGHSLCVRSQIYPTSQSLRPVEKLAKQNTISRTNLLKRLSRQPDSTSKTANAQNID